MRIVHIIPFLWSGAGKVLTDLCVSQQGLHDVTDRDQRPFQRTLGLAHVPASACQTRCRCIAASICSIAIPRCSGKVSKSYPDFVSSYQPDVVHCHSGVPACAAAVMRESGAANFRLIGQLHSWGTGRPKWMNTMDIWGFSRSDLVIANAAAYRRILMEGGVPEGGFCRFHGEWRRKPMRSRPIYAEQRLHWFCRENGTAQRSAGTGPGFRSSAALAPESSTWNLSDQPRMPHTSREIENLFDRQHLSDCVWLGGQVRTCIEHERNWDLFVSLSSDEGQGMAILEAMAMGVPVLARNCVGS